MDNNNIVETPDILLEEVLKKAVKAIASLTENIDDLDYFFDSFFKIKDLKDDIEELEKQRLSLLEEIEELKDENKELNEQIYDLNEEMNDINNKNEVLRDCIKDAIDEFHYTLRSAGN